MRLALWIALTGVTALSAIAASQDMAAGRRGKTLWDTDRSVLFPAIQSFILASRDKPDPKWVQLNRVSENHVLFKNVPEGWSTWKDGQSEGRIIFLDQSGFRVLIGMESVANVEKAMLDHMQYGHGYRSVVLTDQLFTTDGRQVSRVVKSAKSKGDTNVTEHRYYVTPKGAVCVELTVFDEPEEKRTVDDLLAYLRKHYSRYEAVCRQVENATRQKE